MRLVCPNCGAQYEVDDAVIPDSGRDVQCSNCGHTWFQRPPHLDQDLADELGAVSPARAAGPEDDALDEDDSLPDDEADVPLAAPRGAEADDAAPRRRLDPAVAELLREEAEREARARRGEAVEVQSDLGLQEPDRGRAPGAPRGTLESTAEAARRRMQRARDHAGDAAQSGPPEAVPGAGGGRPASRGARSLPDIEAINSTLRPSDAPERAEETAPAATTPSRRAQRRRLGFRIGFVLAMVVVSCGAIVYLLAPEIGRSVPRAEPWLRSYVASVDRARGLSNAALTDLYRRAQALIGGSGEDGGSS